VGIRKLPLLAAMLLTVLSVALLDASPAAAAGAGTSPTAGSVSTILSMEENTAVAGTPSGFDYNTDCYYGPRATVCFEKTGDKIWVEDVDPDGWAAVGYWQNFLRDSSGNWNNPWREGRCTNNLTYGHWGYCNKDFYEDTTYNPYDGWGSGIRLWDCSRGCYGSAWVRNDA
jgi:hypothetical protein